MSYPAPPVPEPERLELGTFVYRDSDDPDEPEDAEAAVLDGVAETAALDGVYGPDDPAYGPPDPSWYDRQREEDEAARRQAEELQHARGPFEPLARGPFEPLRHVDDIGQDHYVEAGYQAPNGEGSASPAMTGEDTGDRGAAALGEAAVLGEAELREGALDQVKDLYMTAEAIGEENLGKHYERLLEKQRQLIGEYFQESGFGGPGASQASVSDESPQ